MTQTAVPTGDDLIVAQGLTKRYGQLTALDNLSLTLRTGEVFGFIGPNGAGKTTTMRILACLLKPDAGRASVCGHDVSRDAGLVRRSIGYMPDFLGIYDDLTVDEYLQFFASAFSIPRSQRSTIIGQVLELTDLTEKRHELVEGLSRGMQQRLGVARVLVHDPKVLFLDEPASGLDPRARIEIRSLIQELGRMGKCVMVSSHILSELGEMCTSIGIIERGKLLFSGSIAEAYARTKASAGNCERVIVTLSPEGLDATTLAQRLSTDARIARASVQAPTGDGAQGPSCTLVIDLPPEEHGHRGVLRAVEEAGGVVHRFEPQALRLEDAFLRLTTGAVQ